MSTIFYLGRQYVPISQQPGAGGGGACCGVATVVVASYLSAAGVLIGQGIQALHCCQQYGPNVSCSPASFACSLGDIVAAQCCPSDSAPCYCTAGTLDCVTGPCGSVQSWTIAGGVAMIALPIIACIGYYCYAAISSRSSR